MKAIFPMFTALALCCAMQAQAKLVISEVLYDAPNNDSTEEFVEIFNDGCTAVSLTGYSLADNGGSFNLSGSIGAGSYFVVAKNSACPSRA